VLEFRAGDEGLVGASGEHCSTSAPARPFRSRDEARVLPLHAFGPEITRLREEGLGSNIRRHLGLAVLAKG